MIGEVNNPTINVIDAQPVVGTDNKFTFNVANDQRLNRGLLLQNYTYEELCIRGLGEHINGFKFQEVEEWRVGRERSAHGVYFGNLSIEMERGDINLPVACKPYGVFESDRALHEFSALEYFKNNPQLRSYSPFGVWYDSSGATVITEFEGQVVSLDNREWQQDSSEPLAKHLDPIRALQKSAQILARLHMRGFAHKDAQIKNMAVNVVDSSIRLVDLTTLERVKKPTEVNYGSWPEGIEFDLQTLLLSIRREGYLANDKCGDVRDVLRLAVLDIHSSMLRHPSSRAYIDVEMSQIIDDIGEKVLSTVCKDVA